MQTKIRLCRGELFLKINKRAGQIPIHVQDGIIVQGEFFLKNNKRAGQNKTVQGELFLKINKCACTSIRHTRVDEKWKKIIQFGEICHFIRLYLVSLPPYRLPKQVWTGLNAFNVHSNESQWDNSFDFFTISSSTPSMKQCTLFWLLL